MSTKMHIILEGFPERVQEAADVLDKAFPGLMTWRSYAEPGWDHAVRLEGDVAERSGGLARPLYLANQIVAPRKAWKLSPTGNASHKAFCASRSKSVSHDEREILPLRGDKVEQLA